MEEEYEKIREQALTEPEKAKAEPEAVEPEPVEPKPEAQEARPEAYDREGRPMPEPKPKAGPKPKAEPKPKAGEKPTQPRMTCEGCGRSYGIHTKRPVCRPPKGFEKRESPQEALAPPPIPGPAERQVTLSDVTKFLFAESKARREKRRDDLLAKIF